MTRRKPSPASSGGARSRFAPRSLAVASALRLTLFLAEAGLLVYAATLYYRRIYPRLGGSSWRSPLAVVFIAAIAWFLLRAVREAWRLRGIRRGGPPERGQAEDD